MSGNIKIPPGPRKRDGGGPSEYSMLIDGKRHRYLYTTICHNIEHRVSLIAYRRRSCKVCGETFYIAEFDTKTGRPDSPRQRPEFYEGCRVARYRNQVNCPDCVERRKAKYSGDHICAICGEEIPAGAKRRDARFCDRCDTPAKRQAFYRKREKNRA